MQNKSLKIKIFIVLICIIAIGIMALLSTQAFVISKIENNVIDNNYDYLLTMDIKENKELEIIANKNSKTIVDIKISNKENNGLINYGIVYSIEGYEESKLLPNVLVYQNSSSLNNTLGNINKEEEKIVSIVIENNENVELKVKFKIILGFEHGGQLITKTHEHFIYKKLYDELLYTSGGINNILEKEITEEPGMYASVDNNGDTFYYKNKDVYVKFIDNYYKIIRINGDKSIRIIYLGKNINDDTGINNDQYNKLSTDNTYVGYMYGDENQENYDLTHSNLNNSNIKEILDNWYRDNLYDYNKYISDTIYCNNRYILNNGFNDLDTNYISNERNKENKKSLLCNINDSFSINKGNKKLTYSIGLITYDEVKLTNIKNDKNIWTMTPSTFKEKNAYVYAYKDKLTELKVTEKAEIKPVISLKENVIVKGIGTKEEPYEVIEH